MDVCVCALEVWGGGSSSLLGADQLLISYIWLWLDLCPHSEVIKSTPAPLWYITEHCLNNIVSYVATAVNLTIGHVFLCAASQGEKILTEEKKADAKAMQIRKSRSLCAREGDGKGENPLSNWIGAVCHHKKAAASWRHNSEWCLAGPSERLAIVHTWTHTQRGSSFLPQTRKILKILCRSSKISHAKSKHTQLASLFLFLKPGSTHVSPLQQTRGSSSVLSHASIIKLLYLTWWLLWFHLPLQSHFLLSSVFLNGIKSHYILNSLYAFCIWLISKFGAENGG